MSLFNTLIPATFPVLALAHFAALLSPGPDFFLLTGQAIRHRFIGAYGICIGIATGNAVYIGLAIIGWAGIRDNPMLFILIETLGAAYLIWLGSLLLGSQQRRLDLQQTSNLQLSLTKQCVMGFTSAILNPKNMLFYLSLMTVILGQQVTLIQQVSCGVWMFAVVLLWDVMIVAMIGNNKIQQRLQRKLPWIEKISGVILIGFAVSLMVSRWYG